VLPDPAFKDNARIYWSYAEAGEGGNSTAVARGRLDGQRLVDVKTIFASSPRWPAATTAARLVFDREGRLFVTLGDRFSRKDDAQPDNHLGKIVRIDVDGRRAGRQPLRRQARLPARDLEPGPPQRAGRGAAPRQRRAVGQRARPAGRRRDQPRAGGPQLRLAAADLRAQLRQRHAHRRGGPESRASSSR
jgi:hypothetical protein